MPGDLCPEDYKLLDVTIPDFSDNSPVDNHQYSKEQFASILLISRSTSLKICYTNGANNEECCLLLSSFIDNNSVFLNKLTLQISVLVSIDKITLFIIFNHSFIRANYFKE